MSVVVRDACSEDLPEIVQLAGVLVRQHYDFDPLRFLLIPNPEVGYARFLRGQLDNAEAIVLVAELDGKVAGYVYAALEPRDWNNLLDACGALYDIYVAEAVRRK